MGVYFGWPPELEVEEVELELDELLLDDDAELLPPELPPPELCDDPELPPDPLDELLEPPLECEEFDPELPPEVLDEPEPPECEVLDPELPALLAEPEPESYWCLSLSCFGGLFAVAGGSL